MVPVDNSSGRPCPCVDSGTPESADRAQGGATCAWQLRSGQARAMGYSPYSAFLRLLKENTPGSSTLDLSGAARVLPRYTCRTSSGWLCISWALEHWRVLKPCPPCYVTACPERTFPYRYSITAHSLLSISPHMDSTEIASVS